MTWVDPCVHREGGGTVTGLALWEALHSALEPGASATGWSIFCGGVFFMSPELSPRLGSLNTTQKTAFAARAVGLNLSWSAVGVCPDCLVVGKRGGDL